MSVSRIPSNGVPWLIWVDDGSWLCEACGESGRQAPYTGVAEFARWLGGLKRKHIQYASHDDIQVGAVGHPLNPNRHEL